MTESLELDPYTTPKGHPSPQWVHPRKPSEIADSWWDIVFNGDVWSVFIEEDPLLSAKGGETFRLSIYREAAKRSLGLSVRRGIYIVYIQTFPKGVSAYDARRPLTEARVAPPLPLFCLMPKMPPPLPVLPRLVYQDIHDKLLKRQQELGLPSYPPVALRRHGIIGWMAEDCNCGTENLRDHDEDCKVRARLLLLEHQIELCNQEPEEWCMKQEEWGHLQVTRSTAP